MGVEGYGEEGTAKEWCVQERTPGERMELKLTLKNFPCKAIEERRLYGNTGMRPVNASVEQLLPNAPLLVQRVRSTA